MAILGSEEYVHFCTQYASIALIYFDYCLTFPDEVRLIWCRQFRYITALYILCRYAMLSNLLYLLYMAGYIPKRIQDCLKNRPHAIPRYSKIFFVISVFGRLAILIIWTLRTWIVCNRNYKVMFILGPLLLVTVILDCIEQQWKDGDVAVAISTLVLEVVSTGIMIYRCLRVQNLIKGASSMPTIYRAIFHDGIAYCIVVILFVLTGAIMYYEAADVVGQKEFFAATSLPVSGMLTARFILHLRKLSDVDVALSTEDEQEAIRESHRGRESDYDTNSRMSFAPHDHNDEEMEMSVFPPAPEKTGSFQSYRIRQPEW